MRIISDLHVHSKYSRATSKDLSLENLEKYGRIKGLNLIGTGDFTHPEWIKELKKKLIEDSSGILKSSTGFNFIFQTEISNIYTQEGKQRRVHNIILAPDFATVEQIIETLGKKGRLDYDGRPIFGFSCVELAELLMVINKDIEVIPAHCLLPGTMIHSNPNLIGIENLKKGDNVLTHKGRYRNVKNVYKRYYKGYIYNIKPRYFNLGLITTEEHPFFAIKTLKDCSWTDGICKPTYPHIERCITHAYQKYKPEWIHAKYLEVGDVLLYPRLKKVKDVNFITSNNLRIEINKDFCKLIGYYLAEGYSNGRDCIGFSFSKNESEFVEEVTNLIKKVLKLDIKKGKTKGDLIVYSNEVRNYFEKNFYNGENKRAFAKCMPEWMLQLPLEKQVEIFKGWWYGDRGSTSSRALMNQFKIICLRLGIVPSIGVDTKEAHKSRGKHRIGDREVTAQNDNYMSYGLSFFEDKFNLLEDKYFAKQIRKRKWRYGWIDENYVYMPILKIKKNFYEGYVYNLEVEADNSYVSEFATIHNCWTPWYSIFGSMSGFDSVEECFQEQAKNIHALETGLSSDPSMNWRLSQLDKYALVSFSDSHSFWPWRIGREATIFELKELTYKNLINALRTKYGLKETIEVDPNFGKYHFTGHRNCEVCLEPKEAIKNNNICLKCRRQLTIGVLQRVEQLADRDDGYIPKEHVPFRSILPLAELISAAAGHNVSSKIVLQEYFKLVKDTNEFDVLLERPYEDLIKVTTEKIAECIIKNRDGNLKVLPGYDGVYGKLVIDGNIKIEEHSSKKIMQHSLNKFF